MSTRHEEGASCYAIARELGMSTETLRVWRVGRGRRDSRAMVPVHVVTEPRATSVSVASSGGYRIEGLTVDEAIAALRALG